MEEAHERYGDNPLRHFRESWKSALDERVSRYQRMVL
jgi:hypothetical protein